MSDLYGFFIVITYIGILIYALNEAGKMRGGGGLGGIFGAAIMGIPYALFWPLLYVFLIWFYFSEKK